MNHLPPVSDRELLHRAGAGDGASFADLFDRHRLVGCRGVAYVEGVDGRDG